MGRVSWTAIAAVALAVLALVLAGLREAERTVTPLLGLAVVLALLSLRE